MNKNVTKKEIVEKLFSVIKLTRGGSCIKKLEYQDEGDAGEFVYGFMDLGGKSSHFRIDVTADSDISMIKDICEYFA